MSAVAGVIIGLLVIGGGTAFALERRKKTSTIPPTPPQNTKFDLVDTQTGQALQNEIISNIDLVALQSQLPPRYQIVNQSQTSSNPTITIPQVFAVLTLEQDFIDAENKRAAIDEFAILSNLV